VLGHRHKGSQNVVCFDSGPLEQTQIRKLLAGAKFVVFPSMYEGFGFPVVESLASRKPVLARSIPLFRTMREKIGEGENLILYSSTNELIERLKQGFPRWQENGGSKRGNPAGSWDTTSMQMGTFISEVVRSFDFENALLPRIHHMQVLGQHAERTVGTAIGLRGYEELASELQDEIRKIYGSWSWRLTSPLRRLGSAYLQLRKKDRFTGQ